MFAKVLSIVLLAFAYNVAGQTLCSSYGGSCLHYSRSSECTGELKLTLNGQRACSSYLEYCCMSAQPVTTPSVPASSSASLNPPNCGTTKSSRVVGGQVATKGDFPWQVQLLKNGRHSCGAILIHSEWVVTAAHCFGDYYRGMSVDLVVGEHNLNRNEGTEVKVAASKFVKHSAYSSGKNDIALVKLSRPVTLNTDHVNAACVPSHNDVSDDDKDCYVSGWGLTRDATEDRNVLRHAQGPLVPMSTCRYYWNVDTSQVCFGNGVHGACKGDSGGPLVCKRNGKFEAIGIVSYGTNECNKKYFPTVFTRIAAYRSWIESVLQSS